VRNVFLLRSSVLHRYHSRNIADDTGGLHSFIADVILYLSYFYKTKELPTRLSWFWTAYMATQIVSAFLAIGILRLRGVHGMEGWRWLFLLVGPLAVPQCHHLTTSVGSLPHRHNRHPLVVLHAAQPDSNQRWTSRPRRLV
jgi:MFS family permease